MNRSYRAPEKEMTVPVKQRQMMGSLRNSGLREKEEELGLFLEMRKCEKERHHLLLHHNAEPEFDSSLESKTGNSPKFSTPSAPATTRKTGADEFLNSENDKNDYEWLLTPPGTPLFPSLEMDSQKTVMNQNGGPKAHPSTLKSRLSSTQPEATGRSNLASILGEVQLEGRVECSAAILGDFSKLGVTKGIYIYFLNSLNGSICWTF